MNGFVLDCSIAVQWCFKDEETPAAYALLDRVWEEAVYVPLLWYIELSNVLLQAERRGRISLPVVTAKLDMLSTVPVRTDPEMTGRAWREILTLARAEKLTTYDATYLELALRKGVALATRDETLREAAKRNGVAVLP